MLNPVDYKQVSEVLDMLSNRQLSCEPEVVISLTLAVQHIEALQTAINERDQTIELLNTQLEDALHCAYLSRWKYRHHSRYRKTVRVRVKSIFGFIQVTHNNMGWRAAFLDDAYQNMQTYDQRGQSSVIQKLIANAYFEMVNNSE